ncbi:MAG: hypothetical protein Q7T11_06935 [Deltaproteobacteria bacterium]|nr:hypothetical protein [Deltaproteobacteria bacterium]
MIPESLQSKFKKFPEGEREEIYAYLSSLRPNDNKLREMLEWIHDVARRDGISPLALLRGIQIPNLDVPQKLEFLRDSLQKVRYPRYAKKKEEFEKIIQGLKLGGKIQVIPSPFFEEGKMEIRFRIGSEEEKKEIIKRLIDPGWGALFEFLNQ